MHPAAPERPGGRTSPSGTPVPPGAPTNPTVQGPGHVQGPRRAGPAETPGVWGRPPESSPRPSGRWPESGGPGPARDEGPGGAWAGAPEAQDAYVEQDGPAGRSTRETGGVQVRLGPRAQARERERRRKASRRTGRNGILAVAGVLVVAGLVAIGLVLTPGSEDGGAEADEAAGPNAENVELPEAGTPVEVGTTDGFRYKLAAVSSGLDEEAATQSAPPSGTSYPYIDYLLSNPTNNEVLLEYPGDVFVKRNLVAPSGRSRCEPQTGVPESWCTPATGSKVVQRLAGGELVKGDGGDQYMPPGSTYMVRITVQVPVQRDVGPTDMSLYVWRQLYMADKPAKHVPFPE
ncbi:hypothetical protein E1281_27190 [Actinomadura sp. KC345]|uniref:hypothetical protein n=1 Tax=Actinomadura sp. KC345 TaxID=2530371 RepID=UPI00104F8478|nr:hypothetical protein [Actinomadura sp. KC345]TDC46844.1 hypothetical protein E1281_27190 [Actinomadura sp. KC345]